MAVTELGLRSFAGVPMCHAIEAPNGYGACLT